MFTNRPFTFLIAVVAGGMILPGVCPGKQARTEQTLSADLVNQAQFSPSVKLDRVNPLMLRAQILLDRAGISPGLIDAKKGENVAKAVAAFQELHNLEVTGRLDPETWNELTQSTNAPAMVEHVITDQEVKGPFERHIPGDLEKMAQLRHLSYASPLELLAEKFHIDPSVLKRLNPNKRFDRAGTPILVPNVGQREVIGRIAILEVDKLAREVRALDANGDLVAFYPASIGSLEKPAPSGRYKVRRIAFEPTYHYNPKFHFKGVHTNRKLTIAPGPKNPVGAVWIDLTKESYGIHGTPDPSRIGKTNSHGCIRLTNWDALDLAKRVRRGTPVDFVDQPSPPMAQAPVSE